MHKPRILCTLAALLILCAALALPVSAGQPGGMEAPEDLAQKSVGVVTGAIYDQVLTARVFVRLVQGVPVLVFLMILFYLVFTGVDNGIVVAVAGFSINFAAYVSEMMRTAIDTVDPGQLEAAAALGFNRVRSFCKITAPQAIRYILPVYRGEFISMVKMTSIVGYITIQDLTRMSDIVRGLTYDAFFSLISTAVIYFALANLLAAALSLLEARVDPKQRKRKVKGVVMQ